MLIHSYHLHKIHATELSEVYSSETMKSFAYGLVGIFIPIFLLQNGMSITNLCLLFLLQNVFRLAIEPLVGSLTARFGAKHILALSYPLSFIFFILLVINTGINVPLYLLAIPWALADSMHAVTYNAVFSKAKHIKRSGREISSMNILITIAGGLAPMIGGFIAQQYGLNVLFISAPILLLVAMIPLYQTIDIVRSKKLNYKKMIPTIKRDLISYAGVNTDVVAGSFIWPLFIYFFVQDYLKVGSIMTISVLVSVLAWYVSGKMSDKFNKKILIFIGSAGLSVVNVFRNFASTFTQALGVNVLGTIVGPFMGTSLWSTFYNHADKTRRIEYSVLMEMAGDASRAVVWAILFILSIQLSELWLLRSSFIIAAVGLLLVNVVAIKLPRDIKR